MFYSRGRYAVRLKDRVITLWQLLVIPRTPFLPDRELLAPACKWTLQTIPQATRAPFCSTIQMVVTVQPPPPCLLAPACHVPLPPSQATCARQEALDDAQRRLAQLQSSLAGPSHPPHPFHAPHPPQTPQAARARQEALDDTQRRLAQLQPRLDLSLESEGRLRAELDTSQATVALRGAELEDAAKQLAAALEGAQRAEDTHRQVRAGLRG